MKRNNVLGQSSSDCLILFYSAWTSKLSPVHHDFFQVWVRLVATSHLFRVSCYTGAYPDEAPDSHAPPPPTTTCPSPFLLFLSLISFLNTFPHVVCFGPRRCGVLTWPPRDLSSRVTHLGAERWGSVSRSSTQEVRIPCLQTTQRSVG